MRLMGAYGLAELGPAARPAAPALRQALNDGEPLIRTLSAYALAHGNPEDRAVALAALVKVAQTAGEDPAPGTFEYMFVLQPPSQNDAQKPMTLAVLDALVLREPGNRFPADYVLRWVKRGFEQPHDNLKAWLTKDPLVAGLAREMVWRLDPTTAQKLRVPRPMR